MPCPSSQRRLVRVVVATLAILLAALNRPAAAACSIQITSAYICDASGMPFAPEVGQDWGVAFTWKVTGTPANAYVVQVTAANATTNLAIAASPGSWSGSATLALGPLDCPLTVNIAIDPQNVTGAPAAGRSTSITMTPTYPGAGIEDYDTATYTGSETFAVDWADSGTVSNGLIWLGIPTTESHQQLLSAIPPPGAKTVATSPSGENVWENDFLNFSPIAGSDIWSSTDSFNVALSSVRVNPTLLRSVSWTQIASTASGMQPWLTSDSTIEANNSVISGFVNASLPANYAATLTPYDAARTLFMAVVKRLSYTTSPTADNSVSVYKARQADCYGFTTLYTACLRNIGIPARPICGFLVGQSVWHCVVEFYLPGFGWVPADPTFGQGVDPTGSYPFFFAVDNQLNQLCVVSRATQYSTSYVLLDGALQQGGFFYSGTTFAPATKPAASLVTFASTFPAVPTSIVVTSRPGSASISWTPVPGATTYRVYRGPAPDGEAATPVETVSLPACTDSNLTPNTRYFYRVTAVGHAGESPLSTEVSVLVTGGTSHFVVSAPASCTAGKSFAVTVTPEDSNGNPVTNYTGAVHFSSTDTHASLPPNQYFPSGGVATFSVTLTTAGKQTITVNDVHLPVITGASGAVTLGADGTARFSVSVPASTVAGRELSFQVTPQDSYGNTVTSYRGVVHFSSSDQRAGLPPNQYFPGGGAATFSATLFTAGPQTVSLTDAQLPVIAGTSSTDAVAANGTSRFVVSAPSSATSGTPFSFTVTPEDAWGNPVATYTGAVHFSSSDPQALLPANRYFPGGGLAAFSATLKSAGSRTITVADLRFPTIAGTSGGVTIGP